MYKFFKIEENFDMAYFLEIYFEFKYNFTNLLIKNYSNATTDNGLPILGIIRFILRQI